MKNKIIIFISLNIFGCVDDYDIDPYVNQVYDAYGNLGFEEGMDHWYGSANMFSTISIDENSYEGQNSLKLSINIDSTSNNGSIVEVSKSLDVVPGDTISVSFQLSCSHEDLGVDIDLFDISSFYGSSDELIHEQQDTIDQISTQWLTINVDYPVPQDVVKLIFGVKLEALSGSHGDIYILVDDFSITTKSLANQVPSAFSLVSPSDNSVVGTDEQINLSWNPSTDQDGDILIYDLQIWTDAVVDNYLNNHDFEEIVTHWLGDEIPADWDYWPYYYHNVFSYPQIGDSIYNQNYVYSGEYSLWVTGDYTGQSNKTILYQGFNTDYIPSGTRVTFSGYMLNPTTDPIQNINQAYISIDQFATYGSIGNTPSWIINHTSESITSSHQVDDWHYFEVSSVTEENTRFLQMRINYEQFNDDSGTVFIDNLMITTSNTHLILHDVTDIDTTSVSINRTVFTDPYDFSERESLTYYWNVIAKDYFSSVPSDNGPFRISLSQ